MPSQYEPQDTRTSFDLFPTDCKLLICDRGRHIQELRELTMLSNCEEEMFKQFQGMTKIAYFKKVLETLQHSQGVKAECITGKVCP